MHVQAVLDSSNQTDKYSAATFLMNAGIPVAIDDAYAIAHNKVIVIDRRTVITGSFNFSKAAEEKNAENLLILDSPTLADAYTKNILLHVVHSHPYERPLAHPPAEQGAVRGNTQSKVYHLPQCPHYERVGAARLVTFETETAAVQAGYRKARNCPEELTPHARQE